MRHIANLFGSRAKPDFASPREATMNIRSHCRRPTQRLGAAPCSMSISTEKSNEDATHEAGEPAAQEQVGDLGQRGYRSSNEDRTCRRPMYRPRSHENAYGGAQTRRRRPIDQRELAKGGDLIARHRQHCDTKIGPYPNRLRRRALANYHHRCQRSTRSEGACALHRPCSWTLVTTRCG
jgi:hypothetical protein